MSWRNVLGERDTLAIKRIESSPFFVHGAIALFADMDVADELCPFGTKRSKYSIPSWMEETGLFTHTEIERFYRIGTDHLYF